MSSNANRQGWWMRFEPRQELTIAPFNFASISGIANLQAGSPLAGEIGLSSLLAKVTFSSSHAYTLAMIIGSLACVGRSTHPYPLGVNFGPINITAALIQENGEPLLVANIVGTTPYQELVLNSLPYPSSEINLNNICEYWQVGEWDEAVFSHGPDRVPALEEIFMVNLKRIKDEATHVLGQPVDISSISAPSHFNDTVRQAIRYSAADTLNHFDHNLWQISTPEYGALHWYNLHHCEGPGFTVRGGPEQPMEYRYAIFVDMNYDYLELVLVGVFSICLDEYRERSLFDTVSRVRIGNMGTKRLDAADQIRESDPSPDRGYRELYRFWHELQHVFRDFSDAHFGEHDHPYDPEERMDAHKGQLHFDLLKAIIISGEAPKAVCENVRHAIAGLFPNHEHRILDSIDPNWVGAVGAAQLAKAQIEYPDALEGWHTCILEPEFASGKHDEL